MRLACLEFAREIGVEHFMFRWNNPTIGRRKWAATKQMGYHKVVRHKATTNDPPLATVRIVQSHESNESRGESTESILNELMI